MNPRVINVFPPRFAANACDSISEGALRAIAADASHPGIVRHKR